MIRCLLTQPARWSIFQAINRVTMVQIGQAALNRSSKGCNTQLFIVEAAPVFPCYIWTHHFCNDLAYMRCLIYVILLSLGLTLDLAIPWSLFRLISRHHTCNRWIWFVCCWLLSRLKKDKDVSVKSCSHLCFGSGEHLSLT